MLLYAIVFVLFMPGHQLEFVGAQRFNSAEACNAAALGMATHARPAPWRLRISCAQLDRAA